MDYVSNTSIFLNLAIAVHILNSEELRGSITIIIRILRNAKGRCYAITTALESSNSFLFPDSELGDCSPMASATITAVGALEEQASSPQVKMEAAESATSVSDKDDEDEEDNSETPLPSLSDYDDEEGKSIFKITFVYLGVFENLEKFFKRLVMQKLQTRNLTSSY